MPAPYLSQKVEEVPLKIVGGNQFGRYPKISDEETFNFIVSDGWLVTYAGYSAVLEASPALKGRAIYASTPGNIMVAVIGSNVYVIDVSGSGVLSIRSPVHQLVTSSGDTYIAENNNAEICITDGERVYVYNWSDNSFKTSVTSSPSSDQFLFQFNNPGYISFQNGRLIIASLQSQEWVLSAPNNATSWPAPGTASQIGEIQSKPGYIQAAVPVPGGGNNILVFGSNVAESWTDLGLALFPYQRNSTFNIDYGCLNASSIAELDNFVVWLAANEQSGPVIMYTQGNRAQSISTDGIDFKLAQLSDPTNCTGFLFRQDGHLIYQFTFITDNLSYAYDFNTQLFFTVTDENLNYHIARSVVFFNNQYYFVSLKGGNIYQFGTQFTDAKYSIEDDSDVKQLPRIRITPPLRLPSQRNFIARSLGFTIENGQPNLITRDEREIFGNELTLATESGLDIATEDGVLIATEGDDNPTDIIIYETASEAVDLSISRDGGETFGSSYRINMNPTGKRKSRFIYQRLGIVNDATFQLRFSGWGRFLASDGIVEIYQ